MTFPDLLEPAGLYEATRRRARARKARTATLGASLVLLVSGGGLALVQLDGGTQSLVTPVVASPSATDPSTPVPPTDPELIALDPGCRRPCRLLVRVEVGPLTFAAVGHDGSAEDGVVPPRDADFLVTRGTQLVDRMSNDSTGQPTSASVDRTGNVLAEIDDMNGKRWLPFALEDGHLRLVQGTLKDPDIHGDDPSYLVTNDGGTEIVTATAVSVARGPKAVYTYERWTWQVGRYQADGCTMRPSPPGTSHPGLLMCLN